MKIDCQAVIFDFDGVICESVSIKTEAFRLLFSAYPDQLEQIVAFHLDNGGLSRYKKFEYIYQHILRQPLSDDVSRALGKKFSEYCYQQVLESPFVEGAYQFLKKFYKTLSLFIVSGTPEEEMRQIVKERKLGGFFKGVYGSPRSKEELNRLILNENHFQPLQVYFVGDSINDYEGAVKAGIPFIGRIVDGQDNTFKKFNVPLLKDLRELEAILNA